MSKEIPGGLCGLPGIVKIQRKGKMLNTNMYVPPRKKEKMALAEIAKHAVRWTAESLQTIGCIIQQAIPCSYVQILLDPETNDEWLHYGTRWMDMEITDTKVKLAPRMERLKQERKDLAMAENQLEALKIVCEDQRKRVKICEARLNEEIR